MRITKEMLLNIAQDTVEKLVRENPSIIAAYLHGSILREDPLLGGTTDIDLVFIYAGGNRRREITRLTDEVTLDIEYHPQSLYRPPRTLRSDPWLGNTIYDCQSIHDPDHFIDFVQASVRGLFGTPENVIERAEPLLTEARQTWLRYHNQIPESGPELVAEYLHALECIANAVACLNGPPLTERRFLLEFPARAEAMGNPGLHVGLLGLLGTVNISKNEIAAWLPGWEAAYKAVGGMPEVPPHLHPNRKAYHLRAYQAMLESENPETAVWPLLRTWTRAARHLPAASNPVKAWTDACDQINLLNDHFAQKVHGLDAYLDTVEEFFENWKQARGLV
ncbi:MAG: hypothetical protein JXB38_20640 [Anaerolineales bacterium]|nr:hypothetical protein [Anaerolineales bacterium]